MIHRIAIALLILLASCARADDAVDALVKAHMAKHRVPGIAVVVVKDGTILKSAGYGVADVDSKSPVDAHTVFPIQSITKQFTATAIMMLVEEGKVSLDAPVSTYLDGTASTWQKITIRHLLTHTSGLKDFINAPVLDLKQELTDEQIFKSATQQPLNFEPGDAWAYSNTNYHLLAMIIRKVSGKWYGDFLDERIFKPLGMTHTRVIRPGDPTREATRGYEVENGTLRPSTLIPSSLAGYGGGGIRSTVLDMAKWDVALYGEKLLKASSLELMWSPVRLNSGATHNYGFGWEIVAINQHRLIWHAGGWVGFSAQIDRFVDDRLTVIVLTNLRSASPATLARAIAGQYLPAVGPVEYKPIPDQEPRVTERLTDLLRRSFEGNLRADEFTPPVWDYLSANMKQVRSDMAALGPIQKLTLVERSETDGGSSYRYRAQFKNTTFIMHFVLTKEDKVGVMMPENVNQ